MSALSQNLREFPENVEKESTLSVFEGPLEKLFFIFWIAMPNWVK